jgi:diaminopimelate decarboxylase
MKIKIETGVPVPKKATRKSQYPFREMEIGNSFFVNEKDDVSRIQQKLSAAAAMFCRNNPDYKFKTQSFTTGVRIWRVQ